LLSYTSGSAAGGCPTPRRTVIQFKCDPAAAVPGAPVFVAEQPTCVYTFVCLALFFWYDRSLTPDPQDWTTAAACPAVSPAPNASTSV
jgi:hypothetical protein